MKKGDKVRSTGKGKTKSWGNHIGTVIRKIKNKIYVRWNETSFEDEMDLDEVELINNIQDVTQIKFTDGMVIHTHGQLRVVEFSDGFYVTGGGKLIPVKSRQEGEEIILQIKVEEKFQIDDLLKLIDLKIEVSLNDLIQLNKISIDNGYNRNLVEDFYLYLNSESRFILQPLITHHFKNGIKCEPHVRYLISQISPSTGFRSTIDLPLPFNLKNQNEILPNGKKLVNNPHSLLQ